MTERNGRVSEAEIDPMFLERWSPRAFTSEPVTDEQVRSLFEAAKWAPSCFNDQPWLFLYARTPEDRALFHSLLMEGNQAWTANVPLLAFAFARRHFAHNGKPNGTAQFDVGAAWMALALEARKLGLDAHGMAGFHADKVYGALNVPEDKYQAMCAIAVGHRADRASLTPEQAKRETPNGRKPSAEVAKEGKLP